MTLTCVCRLSDPDLCLQVEGIVVADLDGGDVTICRTLDLPVLPRGPTEMFKIAYRLAQPCSDIVQLQR